MCSRKAEPGIAEVALEELVRSGLLELMLLDVAAANPEAFVFQAANEMSTDESACTTHQNSLPCQTYLPPPPCLSN